MSTTQQKFREFELFYCAQQKNSNSWNFCWMIRTQPIPLLKLFLLYICLPQYELYTITRNRNQANLLKFDERISEIMASHFILGGFWSSETTVLCCLTPSISLRWLSDSVFKGQLISKWPFGVFNSPKKPKKFLSGFLPQPLKRGQTKKVEYDIQNEIIQLVV